MKLHLAEPWPIPVGLVLLAVVTILVLVAYRALRSAADRRDRRIFLAIRLAAALLLTLLLLEPVLSRDRLQTESLSVVILIDESRSMAVPDSYRGRPRYQVAGEFLTAGDTGLLPLLEDDFRMVPLAFDVVTRAASSPEVLGSTAPSGRLTDIAGAFRATTKTVPRGEIAAVVILSDGAENGGGDARSAARDLGVPIYAVGFGSRAGEDQGRRDLAIVSIDAPDTAFAGNTVVAETVVRSTGYDLADAGNRRVRVVLSEGGEEIVSEPAELTEEGVPVRVPLRFVPAGTGPRTYRVSMAVRGDEAIVENNHRTFSVDVGEHRATVLYFDASLRWEAKFLRDFLARDPAIDLTSVLHSGQGRLVVNGSAHGADLSKGLPPDADGFSKFDVVVLGDVEAAAIEPGRLAALRDRVEEGGGLLVLGGYHAFGPGGYASSPLAEALPVIIRPDDGQRETEAALSMTPEGRVHPILSGLAAWFDGGEPPTLRGLTRVGRAKPGAQALLVAPGEDGAGPEVVFAVQRYGEGRVAAFTGDTTWLWYRSPAWGGPGGLFGKFWGQTLRWLLEREPEVEKTGEPVVLFTDRPVYRIGETVRIRARVSGPEGEPVLDATVTGRLAGPEGSSDLPFSPLPRVAGHYEATIRAIDPGDYRVSATAARPGSEIGRAEVPFAVEDSSVEMDHVDLDDELLAAVASGSGGRYYHSPPSATEVVRDIRGAMAGMVRREEISLVSAPLFFLLFVALMAIEWTLRRRRNLL